MREHRLGNRNVVEAGEARQVAAHLDIGNRLDIEDQAIE
jgi:hypothetical protein